MNYRHSYHAGNFADVLKHLVVLEILQYLLQKPKPIYYHDTHAGRALYDLSSVETGKTGEADLGIGKITQQTDLPDIVSKYLSIIAAVNHDFGASSVKYYPGSPLIVKKCLRATDRMLLTELHPEELAILKSVFQAEPQVALHQLDAYQGLKAFLPPAERRGLVLIDPAFEVKDEFDRIIVGIENALRRFANGIYAIWYPIKDDQAVHSFMQQLYKTTDKVLNVTLQPYPDDFAFGLKACGIAVVNPPWQLEEKLTKLLPWLWRALSPTGAGNYKIDSNSCLKK